MNHYPLLQADMDFLDLHLTLAVHDINRDYRMSAIDRIKAKALQARGVVPRVIASVEADLDSVIASESDIEQKKVQAFAPHFSAIADTKSELAAIGSALDIFSNGGPALDPLPVSVVAAPVSAPTPPPLPSVKAVVDDTGSVTRPTLSV